MFFFPISSGYIYIFLLFFFSFYRQKHQHNTIGYYTCLQSRGQIFQINILNIYSRIPYEWKQFIIIYHHCQYYYYYYNGRHYRDQFG